ncbi:VOC family protein [Dactylosporangium sp. CA-092794]|uniref:VOC family protein n=1 Tax=Dactylosporangium sp. CA-092794 TaxID=3239929 RepID=UPI003D8DF50F
MWITPAARLPAPAGRVHLDLTLDPSAVQQLLSAGARVVREGRWLVLTDPESNEFCVHPSCPTQGMAPDPRAAYDLDSSLDK